MEGGGGGGRIISTITPPIIQNPINLPVKKITPQNITPKIKAEVTALIKIKENENPIIEPISDTSNLWTDLKLGANAIFSSGFFPQNLASWLILILIILGIIFTSKKVRETYGNK